MRLTLNISPCPNDTFMFDALINGRIDTEGIELDVRFADIEELNSHVISGGNDAPHISKISYAIAGQIAEKYDILSSGSALGRGNGPLWVGPEGLDMTDYSMRVAIPGKHTTANLLMEVLHPHITRKQPCLFSKIADTVLKGECDSGVLIHEGRFTYRQKGLTLISDLGIEWEKSTGLPLPLGAIVIAKGLPDSLKSKINNLVRRSVEYAFQHPDESAEFTAGHAREMDVDVIRKHIELFVNTHSIDLGDDGRQAVMKLLGEEGSKVNFVA